MEGIIDSTERQPLLLKPAVLLPSKSATQTDDHRLIDFDPEGDPDNPYEWPNSYKQGVTWLLAFMAFTVLVSLRNLYAVHTRYTCTSGRSDLTC